MIAAGQQVLHYRILEKLGEGGMGVVWSATDTALGRSVAIKVLPPVFAADPERLARFEREARMLASLNHPNIATVYSVHVVDGDRCLTMELVPGEDLSQRIARGPIAVGETLEIARQIALALEAAHEHGIVHRDLKPANVRLTPDARVKVLDFGLAKALEAAAPPSSLSQSPTLVGSVMGSGAIIGTAAYMSPEQARGQSADRRADIWAFGVVLYEMPTGRRAFEGETVSDTLAAVLRAEPDRALLPAGLPRRIRALLERCLVKDPRRRLRDIGEALLTIEDEIAGRPEPGPQPPAATGGAPGRERLLWTVALVAVAAVAVVLGLSRPSTPGGAQLRKYTLALRSETGEVVNPVLSPDGRQVAYSIARKLWVRDLHQISSRALADALDEDFRPLWSPDGEFIVFATASGLSRVAVSSGAIAPICGASEFSGGSGGTWTADGHILFARGVDHIYRVAAGGGVPAVFLARVDSVEGDLHHPHVLPGDRGVLYVRHLVQGGPTTLAIMDKAGRRDLLQLPSGFVWDPVYDPRGFIIFSRVGEGAGLWALPFSLDRLRETGEAFLIAPDGGSPSVGADGTLGYRLGTFAVEAQVVRLDRSGAVVETVIEPRRGNWSLALSPDEKLLAIEVRETGEADVWLHDLERNAQTRFAFGPGRQGEPAWSGDGSEVAWNVLQTEQVYAKPTDGSREPRVMARGFLAQYTADGRYIVYAKSGAKTGTDIWYSPLGGAPDSLPLVQTPAVETLPMPSPRGAHLLYVSDESGRQEVYLRQFPAGAGRWQVSTNGGQRALWSRRGDRIYYWSGEEIYEVAIELEPAVRLGTPRVLFHLGELKLQTWGRYNVVPTSNPDRFMALKPVERTTGSHSDVIVVQNWHTEFAKR